MIPHIFNSFFYFFFNATATTEIYTLSLHDALPICDPGRWGHALPELGGLPPPPREDRKSTRLNSSHLGISYAVFCLKKKIRFDVSVAGAAYAGARGAGDRRSRSRARARSLPPRGLC